MKPRPTKAQILQRVGEILRIRLDGAEFWDVREYVREKEQEDGSVWQLAEGQTPLSDSQLWRYIAKADKEVAASCRASRKKLLRRHLAQRRNLYAKAVSQGDIRTALACLDSETKLLGLTEFELEQQLLEMQRQLDEMKHGNGNTEAKGAAAQGGDSASEGAGPPAAGPASPGPGAGPDPWGADGGPLAERGDALGGEPDPPPLFPSVG
jgi:hypothetical protein